MSRPLRTAETIAVGSELLSPLRTDSNSLAITARLNAHGIEVRAKHIAGDEAPLLEEVFRQAFERSDVVVLCGGLGPTDDDVTREAVAGALGLPLHEREDIVERLRRRFARRGLTMPEENRRQAMVPEGAVVLENRYGTAPGLLIERDGRVALLLPGPPRELLPMLDQVVEEVIAPRAQGTCIRRRVVSIIGLSESHADEALQPLYRKWTAATPPISATILAANARLELHLWVRCASGEEGDALLADAIEEARRVLGPAVYSVTGRSIETELGELLRAAGLRLAVGESCTGGLLAARLTDVPGSSTWFERSIVAYSNQAKIDELGVDARLIEEHGAVSEPVAMAMAEGAKRRAGTDIGIGVTGIAGPGGGTEAKPVGTVAIAIVGPGDWQHVKTWRFIGDRELIRTQAAQMAMDVLRRRLLETAVTGS